MTEPSRSGQAASARWRVSSGGECRWIGVPAASTRRRRRSAGGQRPRFDRRVDDHALTRAIARAVASWGGGSDMESSRRGTRIQVGGRIRASQAGRRREYRRRRREYGVAQAWAGQHQQHRRGKRENSRACHTKATGMQRSERVGRPASAWLWGSCKSRWEPISPIYFVEGPWSYPSPA